MRIRGTRSVSDEPVTYVCGFKRDGVGPGASGNRALLSKAIMTFLAQDEGEKMHPAYSSAEFY
jgi:hypothetical protein